MFGIHAASHGGMMCPRTSGLTEPEQDVVDEDHAEAEHEAGELAVAPVAGAEREADQAEHQARERDRELLLDFEQLAVRINALLLELRGARLAAVESTFRGRRAAARRAGTPSPGSG